MEEDSHFRLRVPRELKSQVEEAARQANRSINAEIVTRLQRSFDVPDTSAVTSTVFWQAFIQVAVEKEIEKRELEKALGRSLLTGGNRP